MGSIADISQAKALLYRWLKQQMSSEQLTCLDDRLEQIAEKNASSEADASGKALERLLFTTFSAMPRYTSKADLKLANADLQAAASIRSGWIPSGWSLDQVGRSLLLLSLPAEDGKKYHTLIEKLFGAADLSEQIALYQSLPLLPHPHLFIARAAAGLRTSMDAVFNAIALNNPFPGDYFEGYQLKPGKRLRIMVSAAVF